MEIKQSMAFRVPVVLLNSTTGLPMTGVVFGDVSAAIQKQATAAAAKTVLVTDWFEIDATKFPGDYDLLLSTSDTDILGFLKYGVIVSGAAFWGETVEIVANVESDTFSRIGAPVGVSISADIAEIEVETDDITAIKAKTDNLPTSPASTGDVTSARDSIKGGQDINSVYTRIGAPVGASISADIAEIEVETDDIAAIKAKTDNLPSNPASQTNLDVAVSTRAAASTAVSNVDYTVARATKIDNLDAAISSRAAASVLGTPAGASIAADIAEVEADVDALGSSASQASVDAIAATLGTPAGASIAADIAEIEVETDGIPTQASIDDIKAELDLVKAKTDNIPAVPATHADVITLGTTALATAANLATLQTTANEIAVDVDGISSTASQTSVTAIKTELDLVKAKTDTLPSSPASTSDITTAVAPLATSSALATAQTGITEIAADTDTLITNLATLQTEADAIKAKTDNIPAVPATHGDVIALGTTPLATAANLSTLQTTANEIAVDVDAIASGASQASVDAVKAELDLVKAKTDNLPASPASTTDVTSARDSVKGGHDVGEVYNRIGSPVGASIAADIAEVEADVDAISGAGSTQASVDAVKAELDLVKAKTDNLPSDPASEAGVTSAITATQTAIIAALNTSFSTAHDTQVRILGLLGENTVHTNTRDLDGKILTITTKLYDTRANAITNDGTGLLDTYTSTATYIGTRWLKHTKVIEP